MDSLFTESVVTLNSQPMTSDLIMALRNTIPFDRNNPPLGGWNQYLANVTTEIVSQVIEIAHLDRMTFIAELQTLPDWSRLSRSATFSPQTEAGIRRALIEWGMTFLDSSYDALTIQGNFSGGYLLKNLTPTAMFIIRDPYHDLNLKTTMADYRLDN